LHLAKGDEDVFFAGEIVEECALAHVGGIGDVLNGRFRKAFFCEKLESSAEEAFASLQAATLTPIDW
jgi:NAD(P)H-hydrate repair Nnr-like enzyme with NAD(P)H-hydrate dehydratase domain